MRKKETKRRVIKDEMLAEAERAVEHMTDLIEKNELQPYLKGGDIRGDLVDDSEDITPEQVATLGAYTMAIQLRDNLKNIMEGKEVKRTDKKIEVVAIELKNGKQKTVQFEDVPQEVKDALKKFLEDNSNE